MKVDETGSDETGRQSLDTQCGVLCNCTLCPTLMLILAVIITMSYTVLEDKSRDTNEISHFNSQLSP